MLRLLDRYLIREIVPYLLLGLLLLTAIIFAQEASRFSELLVVASRKGLPMETLWRVMSALVPGIFVFTLPISLLVGTLVGLGRLSGDSEIVALGASGASRLRMLAPIVFLSLIVATAMLYITFTWLPRSIHNLTDLKANQSLVFEGLNTEIKARVFEESIPQKVLYIEDIDRANNLWHNIFLVDMAGESQMKVVTATSGSLRQGERSEMPELHLERAALHQTGASEAERKDSSESQNQTAEPIPVVAPPVDSSASSGQVPQEKQKDKDKKKQNNNRTPPYTVARFDEMTYGLEVSEERKSDATGIDQAAHQVEEMEWADLLRYTPAAGEAHEWRAEIHKRLALPAACLVFALLGVGFGISNVRTGRSFGLLLGLAITIAYYLLALWGQHAALAGTVPVWLGIWLANILLTALGVLVLLSGRRPGSDPLSALSSLRHAWPSGGKNGETGSPDEAVIASDRFDESVIWSLRSSSANSAPLRAASRLRGSSSPGSQTASPIEPRRQALPAVRRSTRAQLLDRLVLSDLSRFFVFILAGFSSLFLIVTLFQLLDYISRNNIEWVVVANYLIFLLPMILNYVAPIAALVAVMVTFGILHKTSQVVALKASGQSVFRLAAPALLASLLLSVFVFVNQDYIMPFTNRRQNNLRYLIRKGQEPPQTFYQTTNQWICGAESRIFNYAYFTPTTNTFARLSVLDLSREPFSISRRLYARRAWWDEPAQQWVLESGWERRFEGDKPVAYEPFDQRRVTLAEHPDYFKKETVGSSSMTLAELRRAISDLSRSGFDVLDLRIALQSKIAFPLTCLVMVIVGLPFSFSVGKRGALYGVAAGMAIGLAYWGLTGLFEQMGRYEMLPPMLAAWGPNMLFGAGGLYLFLTSRT
ncbi:MAG TPA: LptF/LptG family permease [Blastocatellia bacterium]|nr:LptF/LptG family permease [Blastocatellia bacterium]